LARRAQFQRNLSQPCRASNRLARLAAAKLLGWSETPVTVVDLDSVARREFAENVHRKNFAPSELVVIGAEVERIERESAGAVAANDPNNEEEACAH
jgi:hypothetical protein